MDQQKENRRVTPEEKRRAEAKTAANKERAEKELFLSGAKDLLARSVDARRRYDYEWMVRDMFRRGYHFSRYQPTTQTVILASRQSAKIPVNLTASAMRSIRNQVTSFRPKWEVLPRYTSEESKTQARYTGMLLDYFFDHLNLKTKIKETVTHGLITSVGIWEIFYDEAKGEVGIWLIDPFDFYVDPYAETLEDAEFCIKAVRRPLDEVLKNPEYNIDARQQIVSPEARLALSEYKQFMIQAMKNMAQYQTDRNSTVILFQGSFKVRDEQGKIHIREIIWTDQNTIPLSDNEIDEENFRYVMYRADINPKEIYGEGWMKHIMPINRVIDMLESSVYDYNHRVAKGRIVVDRDAGVKAIHNIHGEIVSKNRGSEVKAMDMPSLPIAVQNQVERMGRYFEDIAGVHDASLGRLPTGIKSGIGAAELKQSDATNQDDLVDNLEDFLEEVAQKILLVIANNYEKYKVIQALGHKEEDEKYFAVVGKKSGRTGSKDEAHKGKIKIGPDWLDLAIIGDDNNIRVTVGSWLGYTKEMMQEKVLKYAQAGLIDQATALRLLEFGSVDEIVQQTRKEALLKSKLGQQPALGQHPGEADQYGLALTENQMLLEGKPVKPDPHDDHEVHLALHQEALGQGADDLVGEHIQLHQMYLNQQWGIAQAPSPTDQTRNQQVAQQQAPQQGGTGGMPQQGAPAPGPQQQPGGVPQIGSPAPGGQPGQ